MNSTSFLVANIEELANKVENTISNKFQPTLAIVFGSVSCNLEELPDLFNHYGIDLIGASTAGEICDDTVYVKSISVMLLDINRSYYKIHTADGGNDYSEVAGVETAKYAKTQFESPAFLTFFGLKISGEEIINGFKKVIPDNPIVFGGLAADDLLMTKTFSFTNDGLFEDKLATLIFDNEKVEVSGTALCGWEPIGTVNTITKAERNVIYTINGKPALEAFEAYFGDYHQNVMTSEDGQVAIGVAQYPLQIIRGNDVVLRAALSVNPEDNSIMMAGPVKTGDQFQFSVAPGFEIIDETIAGFQKYHQKCPDADVLILISCVARHMSLGPLINEEVQGIQGIWNKPLVGFFSYGEVGMSETGDCNFYNETCSLVILKEK